MEEDAMVKTETDNSQFRNIQAREVAWYRQHSKYPSQRIRRTSSGAEYVVGDWGWHRRAGAPTEYIEGPMHKDLGVTR